VTAAQATWYLYTAGVPVDSGYTWYPLTEGARTADASNTYYTEVGGRRPSELLGGEKPSLLLGRTAARGWVLAVGGLVPPDVPVGRWRRIHATLLGVAPPGGAVRELIEVAARALADELEPLLPVRWDAEQRPEIVRNAPWPPPPLTVEPVEPRGWDTSRYYADAAEYLPTAVQHVRALAKAVDLEAFPAHRPFILRRNLLDVKQCAEIQPWLAVGGEQTTPKDITMPATAKECKRRRRQPEPVTALGGPSDETDHEEDRGGTGEGGAAVDAGHGDVGAVGIRARAVRIGKVGWVAAAGGTAALVAVVVLVTTGGQGGGSGAGSGVSASPRASVHPSVTATASSSPSPSPSPSTPKPKPTASAKTATKKATPTPTKHHHSH
jgi:hypothetical protein